MLQQIDEVAKTDEEYIGRRSLIKTLKTFAPEHFTPLIDLLITKEPAADVVKVVRCENCKIGFKKFVKGKEVIECQRHAYDDPRQYKHLNDFCSYGVSKEGTENEKNIR